MARAEAPTASAVIADVVEAASEGPQPSPVFGRPAAGLTRLQPADSKALVSPWYLRFEVLDVPGVLAGHLQATCRRPVFPLKA